MKRTILLSLLLFTGLFGCQSVVEVDEETTDGQEVKVNIYVDSCWNRHKTLLVHDLMTDDYTRNLNGIRVANGKIELEANIKNYIRAFPTLKIKIDTMIQKDRHVVTTWSFEGTNTGEFGECMPTGKKVKVSGVSIFQFNDAGNILREDTYYNELYLLQQLGYTLTPPNLE